MEDLFWIEMKTEKEVWGLKADVYVDLRIQVRKLYHLFVCFLFNQQSRFNKKGMTLEFFCSLGWLSLTLYKLSKKLSSDSSFAV